MASASVTALIASASGLGIMRQAQPNRFLTPNGDSVDRGSGDRVSASSPSALNRATQNSRPPSRSHVQHADRSAPGRSGQFEVLRFWERLRGHVELFKYRITQLQLIHDLLHRGDRLALRVAGRAGCDLDLKNRELGEEGRALIDVVGDA